MAVQPIEQFIPHEAYKPHLRLVEPLVQVVPEQSSDHETRLKAAAFVGDCLAGREIAVEYAETTQPIESLYDAIQLAAETGSEEAYSMIRTNVAADVVERTIKAGHITEVELHVDEAGRIQQFGQSMEMVQANSLRLMADGSPQMLERTKAEALNTFRIQEKYDQGLLHDYSFVVISRAPDDMTEQEMADAGFFTDTMSFSIQATTIKDGHLKTESAFVAGAIAPGAPRHDAVAMAGLGEYLGVDLSGMTATQLLNTPLLVRKDLMPEGVVELVAVCDDATGGFFGIDKPQEDYLKYRAQCREREALLQPKVDSIVAELIAEAPTIRDRVRATERLRKISGKHMVQQAMFDYEIDPRVFGDEAASHILEGRYYFEQGLIEQGLKATHNAERTEVSSSCPSGSGRRSFGGRNSQGERQTTGQKDETGDCEFVSKKCPKCGAKKVKTVVSKGKITGSCGCTAKLK
jgi:hypothetical protein